MAARGSLPPGARPTVRQRMAMDSSPWALRLPLMLFTCVLAAVVVAGLAFPVIGGLTGLAAAESNTFDDLPADLATPPLPEHSVLYDSSGTKVIATLRGAEDRVSVTLDKVPDVMRQAIISIEDARFYDHHGVDLKGIVRAVVKNNQGGSVQGASTLTQQYVKNVLEEQATTTAGKKAATARTTQRKLREARYALELERKYSKNEILERYLNIAYFGEGVYGVGTAATHYFKEDVSQLTLPQAALLAGIVNSPLSYDPVLHPQASTDRRNTVLQSMLKQHYISDDQESAAEAAPLIPTDSPATHKVDVDACVGSIAPFFCAYARQQLLDDPKLGSTPAERQDKLFNGGLRIRTTLDLQSQKAADDAIGATLAKSNRVAAIEAIVEPGTGHVLAMAANRTYGPKRPGSTDTEVALMSQPTFQGGSTFKAFTLASALTQGIGIHTTINSPGCYVSQVFTNPEPRGCFHNAGDDAEAGRFDLSSGTWYSVNTFFIQLEERAGVQNVIDTAVRMGIPRARFQGLGATSGSVTLGALPYGVAPLELANAYATIAAHGVECDPSGVIFMQTQDGKRQTPTVRKCQQAISSGVADTVSSILQGVLTQSGATAAGKGIGRPAAGKTGTLDNEVAAWFVGFTPQMSAAVVLGDPTASSAPLGTVTTLKGQVVQTVFGGTIPTDIWQASMEAAMAGKPVESLPAAVGSVALGDQLALPSLAGLSVAAATQQLEDQGFGVTVNKKPVYDPSIPKGLVVTSNPSPGFAAAGTTIDLIISNGPAPAKASKSPQPSHSQAPPGRSSPVPPPVTATTVVPPPVESPSPAAESPPPAPTSPTP